jgi:hypothetical protein
MHDQIKPEIKMNLPKSLFIILVPVLLSCGGCSKVTFGYNHADWLLRYWVTDYTSFNAEQEAEIRLEAAAYMHWHRETALPEYIAFLQNLAALVDRDAALTAGDVIRFRAESGRLYRMTMAPFIRPAAHVLSTLDRRQIDELRDTLADRNRKQKKELLFDSAQENLIMRAERHVDNVERLVGHLSGEQEEKITEMSLRIPFATSYYIEQREAKQASLISLLNDHAGEAEIAALFRQWIDTPEVSRSAQQQHAIEDYESAMNEMTARIFELLTPRQRDHLRKKIAAYIDDFQQLHSATPAREPRLAE